MATLPDGATLHVYKTNCSYPFIFTVSTDGLQRWHYWSSGRRFKTVRQAHWYCSAHGNIREVWVKVRDKYRSYDEPSMVLTAGEFRRAKLPERSMAE
jgi:hypothetical protein